MPSGKTHDLITLLAAAPTFIIVYLVTNNVLLSTITTVTTLFGGLMFGPDLDINSREYQRWGPLRILWWPYRNLFSHRSRLTHGIILGPVIRIIYFFIVFSILLAIGLYSYALWQGKNPSQKLILWVAGQEVITFLRQIERPVLLAGLTGCWWGAAIHTLADLLASLLKQIFKSL